MELASGAAHEDELGSSGGERQRDGAADTAPSASHQRNLAVEAKWFIRSHKVPGYRSKAKLSLRAERSNLVPQGVHPIEIASLRCARLAMTVTTWPEVRRHRIP